ncbi:MAG: UbiA family prenyltransferase [Phycisphaerales bacterium]
MSDATPTSPASVGAWMRLLRISNAPTALTGSLVGTMVGASTNLGALNVNTMALCGVGSVLLYAGGMVMNDYFDQPIDRIERPDRPIVSGQVSERSALLLGMGLLVAGVTTMIAAGSAVVPWALLLLAMILAYNLLHRDPAAAPLLMASCRMLVPVISAIAAAPQNRPDWELVGAVAIPLGVYTATISLAARHEAARAPSPRPVAPIGVLFILLLAAALAPLALMLAGVLQPFPRRALTLAVPALVLACWTMLRGLRLLRRDDRKPHGVMAWIAAIAFIDAASLAPLAGGSLVLVAVGAGLLTLWMQRRILGS